MQILGQNDFFQSSPDGWVCGIEARFHRFDDGFQTRKLFAYIVQLRENVKAFYQYVDESTDYSEMIAYLDDFTEVTEETYINGC